MEIAGLLTGILPDTVEVLKCFKLVSEKLHVFRHWSREVGRIHDKVWTQRCIFEHEWKHLLTGVVGSDEEATLMLSDPGHIWWADQSLDTCIKECLGSDAELLSKLVQNLVRQLGELQRGLNAFEPVGSLQRRDEPLKAALIRLRSATRITFDKGKYEKQIEAIRQDNADLRAISAHRPQRPPPSQGYRRERRKELSKAIIKRRHACTELYDVLKACFGCRNQRHGTHAATLSLSPSRDGGHDSLHLTLSSSLVQSERNQACVTATMPTCISVQCPNAFVADIFATPMRPTVRCPRKHDMRHPCPCNNHEWPNADLSSSSKHQMPEPTNLQKVSSTCDHLSQWDCCQNSPECLGYVESTKPGSTHCAHVFYHDCKRQSLMSAVTVMPMCAMLSEGGYSMTVEDQLLTALTLAYAVLQLHGSAWLPDRWRTANLACIKQATNGPQHVFDSLQVTADLPNQVVRPPMETDAGSVQHMTFSDDEVRCLFGVCNATLFSLGIAMLEIAFRSPLEAFRLDRDQNEIHTARRLAQRPSMLGQRYQRVAQRCLQCDFGWGDDLRDEGLQSAVYVSVVCELEDMLNGFRIILPSF